MCCVNKRLLQIIKKKVAKECFFRKAVANPVESATRSDVGNAGYIIYTHDTLFWQNMKLKPQKNEKEDKFNYCRNKTRLHSRHFF